MEPSDPQQQRELLEVPSTSHLGALNALVALLPCVGLLARGLYRCGSSMGGSGDAGDTGLERTRSASLRRRGTGRRSPDNNIAPAALSLPPPNCRAPPARGAAPEPPQQAQHQDGAAERPAGAPASLPARAAGRQRRPRAAAARRGSDGARQVCVSICVCVLVCCLHLVVHCGMSGTAYVDE